MHRSLIVILFAILLSAEVVAQPESFAEFVKVNPGYFQLGVGTAIPIGSSTSFSGIVPTAGGQTNAAISVSGDTSINLDGGYRFASLPVRLGFSFVSSLNNLDAPSVSNSLSAASLSIKDYTIAGLYDYAITPHWIASAGAALGFASFVFDQSGSDVDNIGPAPTHNRFGFAYQGIAELMYRFTGITLGVTYHFIGSTVRINSIYPSADNQNAVLGSYFGFTAGVMFW